MAAIELVDFQDIYTAVAEKVKIPTTDTTTIANIKRFVNITYEDIVSRQNWWWLRDTDTVQTKAQITTGTVSITNESTSITFSSAPSSSVADYKFKVQGFREIYTIDAHTAAATTATLNVAFKGTTNTTASYTLWKDNIELSPTIRETLGVRHDHHSQPMTNVGLDEFRRIVAQNPTLEQEPTHYTTDDFNVSGERILRYWPAVHDDGVTLHIDYLQDVVTLDLDGDEPLLPQQYRQALYWGTLAHTWDHERNEEQANKAWQRFEGHLAQMAGKLEDSSGHAQLKVSQGYLQQKRRRRRGFDID